MNHTAHITSDRPETVPDRLCLQRVNSKTGRTDKGSATSTVLLPVSSSRRLSSHTGG